ncbi:MAG: dTDP-4-dehydrorhamnose reductase [Xanthomonadales bacterium]|nr:dTDP-4-dehydrorhamnose reductase [Xanthomonadales bacterium]
MKLLLLGANGQVGHALLDPLARLGDVVAATRDGRREDGSGCLAADLADPQSLAHALDESDADVVVNAAAHTAVDRAEDEPELADRVNHYAVAEIGAWAARRKALVVHYSTDYVFDGRATRPYREDDATGPLGVYGRTKLAGEVALRASGAQHLLMRTAWVHSATGHNFVRTMLRLAAEREVLRVVADQVGSPTPAHWIAAASARIVAHWSRLDAADRRQACGTYHLAAASRCSWHDFAVAIFDGAAQRGLIARAPRVEAIATSDYPTRTGRPAWSVLDTTKLALVFGVHLPSWEQGLREVLDELASTPGAAP